MFEQKHQPLLPRLKFVARFLRSACIAIGVVAASLAIGTVGYHRTEGLPWLDAALNASMILTGMGPVNQLQTAAGKTFAIGYSLFSGVVFLTMAALLFAPLFHRFLHRFHLDNDDDGPKHPHKPPMN